MSNRSGSDRRSGESPGEPVELTVAVCTRGRIDLLERCVESLARQRVTGSRWELLVVENGAVAVAPDRIVAWQMVLPKEASLRVRNEAKAGLAYARNSAIRHALGRSIAFLDDDAEASPSWLVEILTALRVEPHRPTAVGGPVTPRYEARPSWFREEYERDTWGDESRWLRSGESFSGNNMAFRRDAIERWGGFDTRLGMRGNRLALGEDTELFLRVWRQWPEDARFLYVPEATVVHWIPKAKTTVRYSVRRAWSEGVTFGRITSSTSGRQSRAAGIQSFLRAVAGALPGLGGGRDPRQWVIEEVRPRVVELGVCWGRSGSNRTIGMD